MARNEKIFSGLQNQEKRRSISLYWREKTLILLFAAQMHGVVLRAAAFPPQWRIPMSWSLLVNLDILRYSSVLDSGESSVFGFDVNEPFLSRMAWAGAYSLLAITTFFLRNWLLTEADRNAISIERFRKTLDGNILFLASVLHVPACLAYSSFFSSFWPASPSAAPAVALTNPGVILAVIVLIPPALIYSIMTPIWLLIAASKHSIHADRHKHEYALQTTEIEYALRLSDVWLHEHVWTMSSFSRSLFHSYDAGLWTFFSGACAWISAGASVAPGPQADVIFAVLALWSFRHTFSPTFRCRSSNLLLFSVIVPLVVTSFFGLLRAHEISNELTVDRRLTQILTIVNITGAAAALFSLSISFLFGRGWPLVIGTSEKLHNSSAFEELSEGLLSLFGPLLRKHAITSKTSTNDDDDDDHHDLMGDTTMAAASSMSASIGAPSSSDKLVPTIAFDASLHVEKESARTFIEMRDIDLPIVSVTGSIKRVAEGGEVDDFLQTRQQDYDVDIFKVEGEIVARLRTLKAELSIQRSRPPLLVDVNKLQTAVSALQRPFGNALFLKLTLANACTDAISESCVEIENAKKCGSIANHPLFTSTQPPVLSWLRIRMDARSSEFVLLPKRKSSVLLKLLAIRSLVGDRKLTPLYISGVNDSLFLSNGSSKPLLSEEAD